MSPDPQPCALVAGGFPEACAQFFPEDRSLWCDPCGWMPPPPAVGSAEDLLRRVLTEQGQVEDCHHEGCSPWLSIGDGDGFNLTDDDLVLALSLGATDARTHHVEATR